MAQINLNSSEHKIWFTSDTHFGHTNIIKYCNRPYENASTMNEDMINRWNSVVGPNDIVFHLGDFGFGKSSDLVEIRKRLNGKIYLIIGNHDWHNINDVVFKNAFETVTPQMRIRIDGQLIYLNHMPFLCFDGAYNLGNATWQLFGHVHSNKTNATGLDINRLINLFPSQYDVGCDNNNYTPISFEEVKEIISEQILSQNLYRGGK